MSDLRNHLSGLLAQEYPYYGLNPEDHNAAADAVLRVVGDALMSDEAVNAAWEAVDDFDGVKIPYEAGESWKVIPRAALSAAWRVAMGGNHE